MATTLELLRSGKLAGATRLVLACGLTEFPREIFDLADSLEVLDLSRNQLSSLPDDFARLGKLKIVFLSENRFRHLPGVLGECAELKMIGFKSNQLETIDPAAFPPLLRWLILTDNRLRSLPASLGNCAELQKLMLAGNALDSLPDSMANCTNLELLRLSANQFSALPEWLLTLPKLSWLAFGGNPVSAPNQAAAQSIAEIDFSALVLREVLGEGASGVIWKADWPAGGRSVAVKLFKGAVTSDGFPADEMAVALAVGTQRNLVPLCGRIVNHPNGTQGLVMELISADYKTLAGPPSLDSCTRDVYAENVTFTRSSLNRLLQGVAAAAQHLHTKGILHGDLYAHNLLWRDNGDAFLGDFGAASWFPSACQGERLRRIEVRAFGCLISECLDRCPDADSATIAALSALRDRCLSPLVAERPVFDDILRALKPLPA